ncbi:MAG: hypothetical protein SFZ02_02600 [bacterium]|nr:hypothetical protein [bacterium]
MLPAETPLPNMKIIEYPHHFYEFVIQEDSSSRRAFDSWIAGMEKLYQLPSETPLKVLTNAAKIETVSLTYPLQKSQLLLKKYPNHPKMRLVVLMPESQGIFSRILLSFPQLVRTDDEIRTMYGDKREQAIDWLFANERHNRPQHLADNA